MGDDEAVCLSDWVELRGLVNAPDLNGKLARVTAERNTDGRASVAILGVPNEPKLIKLCNLRRFPDDKDIPDLGFPKSNGDFVPIRIENGAGHSCVDCGCDLAGRYYVVDDDKYYCERDYAEKHHDHTPFDNNYCVACWEYIPRRDGIPLAANVIRRVYPDGKFPSGLPCINTDMDPPGGWVHKQCFECARCGISMRSKRQIPHGYRTRSHDGHLCFLCAPPPGSAGWCDNEWDGYIAAKKRLTEIEALSGPQLESLLNDRNVPVSSGDDKESLVRKVFVTDKKKGRKIEHVVTAGSSQSLVTARLAPGAELRDRRCLHGGDPFESTSFEHRAVTQHYMMSAAMVFQSGDYDLGFEVTADYWARNVDVLRDDVADRCIPRSLWTIAVTDAIHEDGELCYDLSLVAGSLIADAIQEVLAERSNFTAIDAKKLLRQPRLRQTLDTISAGKDQLFLFMHQPDRRKCNCMTYVATAAEIGKTWNNKLKISKDIEHCAVCKAALASPKICSACKEVAYCGVEHQREHWKTHKKTCTGRSKK